MQGSLNLKSYDIPENASPEARQLFEKMSADMEKMASNHQQQIAWLKQKFRIAMNKMRPEFIIEETLRELFDESELLTDPDVEVSVDGDDDEAKGKKGKRKKKKKAIPDHLPRTIVDHDLDESKKSGLSPM